MRWLRTQLEAHRHRLLAFLALIVVAVPTFFAIFGEAEQWPLLIRVVIGLGWVLLAGSAAAIAAHEDERLRRYLRQNQQQADVRHDRTRVALLMALFQAANTGAPASFRWTVAVRDDSDLLQPVYPDRDLSPSDPRVFRIGTGASGVAFQKGGVVIAMGDAVSNDQFRLTEAQQAHFAKDRAVAAVPLVDRKGQPFGALSAISEQEDHHFEMGFASESLRNLAETVTAVLLDVSSKE